MLKNIATAQSECTTQHKNMVSYNTDYIIPNFIDFFGDDWKRIEKWIEKRSIYIFVINIMLTKN